MKTLTQEARASLSNATPLPEAVKRLEEAVRVHPYAVPVCGQHGALYRRERGGDRTDRLLAPGTAGLVGVRHYSAAGRERRDPAVARLSADRAPGRRDRHTPPRRIADLWALHGDDKRHPRSPRVGAGKALACQASLCQNSQLSMAITTVIRANISRMIGVICAIHWSGVNAASTSR